MAYPVNISSGADWLREQSVRLFLRAAEICSELQSPLLFLTAGRGYEDEPVGPAWERSVTGLRAVTARAEELGVVCVLEPLQRVESNLVTDVSSLARMLHDVGSPALGGVIDTVATAVAGDHISDYRQAFGDRVQHVHLVDGAPGGHLAWGDGTLDLNEILLGLSELNYQGALTFELFGDGSYALEPRTAVEKGLHAVEVSAAGLRAR